LRDLLAVTATKEETVNSAVPEVRAIISGANVAPSSKLEYAKGVWPTMLADETQDLNTEEAALSQGVSFGALPPAPLQRKRSHDDHNGVRKVKRMKSSNPVQPINVGDTE